MGKKINLQDFDTMEFDDGVPKQYKDKIVKAAEDSAKMMEESEEKEKAQQNVMKYTEDS